MLIRKFLDSTREGTIFWTDQTVAVRLATGHSRCDSTNLTAYSSPRTLFKGGPTESHHAVALALRSGKYGTKWRRSYTTARSYCDPLGHMILFFCPEHVGKRSLRNAETHLHDPPLSQHTIQTAAEIKEILQYLCSNYSAERWGRYWGLTDMKWEDTGENYVMRSFMVRSAEWIFDHRAK